MKPFFPLVFVWTALLLGGCVGTSELVLYNNSGRTLEGGATPPVAAGEQWVVPFTGPEIFFRFRNETGRTVEYRFANIPGNFQINGCIFAQLEADGRVYLVRSDNFPSSTIPAQPKGFPMGPFAVSGPEYFPPELKNFYNENRFAELAALAKQKNPAAQFLAGTMLIEGRGVPRDVKKSLPYLLDAAAADFPPAQCLVGSLYLAGGPLEKNPLLAMRLLTYAAQREYVPAQTELARCYYFGTPPPVNYERARYWLEEAEKRDPRDPRLLKLLGVVYQEGKAVPADPERARDYLKRAGITLPAQ